MTERLPPEDMAFVAGESARTPMRNEELVESASPTRPPAPRGTGSR